MDADQIKDYTDTSVFQNQYFSYWNHICQAGNFEEEIKIKIHIPPTFRTVDLIPKLRARPKYQL